MVSKPKPAIFAGAGAVLLAEAVKYKGQKVLADACAVSRTSDFHIAIAALQPHLHLPLWERTSRHWSKRFQTICRSRPEIAKNRAGVGIKVHLQANIFGFGSQTHRVEGFLNNQRQLDGLNL